MVKIHLIANLINLSLGRRAFAFRELSIRRPFLESKGVVRLSLISPRKSSHLAAGSHRHHVGNDWKLVACFVGSGCASETCAHFGSFLFAKIVR
jgi:hypothetical protein